MTKKKKWSIGIGIVAFLGVVLVGVYKSSLQSSDDSIIRIGVILPLTGAVSEAGMDMHKGVLLAKDYYEKKGIKIILKIEDGKYLSKETIGCFNKLMLSDVDCMLVAGQVPTASIKPLVLKEKIPTMATIAGAKDIPLNNNYMSRCYFSAYRVGRCMGEYASTNLNLKSVAILKIDNEWGMDSANGFTEGYKGKVSGEETFDISDTDIRVQISKLLKNNPDGVFVTGFGPGFATCFNRLIEIGYKGKIMTDPGILEPAYQKNIKDVSNIYYVCSAFNMYPGEQLDADFFSGYRSRYEADPSLFSAFAYTAAMILIEQTLHENISVYSTPIGTVKLDSQGDVDIPLFIGQFH